MFSHQIPIAFCSTQHSTQSANASSPESVSNKLHIEATYRIRDTDISLPSNFPSSSLGANVRVVTDPKTTEHRGVPPVTEHRPKVPRIKRIWTQPPVLRYIPIKHTFTHDEGTRRRCATSLLLCRTRCYNIPVVTLYTKNKKNNRCR